MKTKSMMERPMLGQFLDVLISSDRIVIYDGEDDKSPELYRGFAACIDYDEDNIDKSRRIAKTGLGTDIFRKDRGSSHVYRTRRQDKEEIPVESISDFKFSDLEEIVYTSIFLEVAG